MTTKTFRTAKILAGTALVAATFGGAAAPAMAQGVSPATGSVSAKPNPSRAPEMEALTNEIQDKQRGKGWDNAGRSKIVEQSVKWAYESNYNAGRYTVVIVNQDQDIKVEGDTSKSIDMNIQNGNYKMYLFDGPATVTNKGDGGWLNWGAYGDTVQRDDHGSTKVMRINGA